MRPNFFIALRKLIVIALFWAGLAIYPAQVCSTDKPLTVITPSQLIGLWAQVDEKNGKVQSLVRIVEVAPGLYEGTVEKLFPILGDNLNPRCEECQGDRKNQPVLGMRIITGLRRTNGNANSFDGGEILDPDSGDIYRLKITILEAGKKLDVRGFIGISLFGRSQTWLRETLSTK